MSDSVNPYASPLADDAPPPGVKWAGSGSLSLRQVGRGLACVYYGIVLTLLAIIGGAIGGLLAFQGSAFAAAVFGLFGLVLAAGAVLLIVGPLLCLATPAETGARGFIIAAVALQLAQFALSVFNYFSPLPLLEIPSNGAISIVSILMFSVFLWRLAVFIERPDLIKHARHVLIGFLTIPAAALCFVGANYTDGRSGWLVALSAGFAVGAILVFVGVANLVGALRTALLRDLPSGGVVS